MKNSQFWWPVIASVVATPVLLLLAIGSTGAGHADNPVLPGLFFPFPLLAIRLLGDSALLLVLLLWVAQYPLYGVALGLAARRGLAWAALLGLLALHGLAAWAELSEIFGGIA